MTTIFTDSVHDRSLYIDINETNGVLSFKHNDFASVISFKQGEWVDNATARLDTHWKFFCSKIYAEWKAEENTLELIMWHYEMALKTPVTLKFNKNKTKITVEQTSTWGFMYNYELDKI